MVTGGWEADGEECFAAFGTRPSINLGEGIRVVVHGTGDK